MYLSVKQDRYEFNGNTYNYMLRKSSKSINIDLNIYIIIIDNTNREQIHKVR